jgi:hypothetical protein
MVYQNQIKNWFKAIIKDHGGFQTVSVVLQQTEESLMAITLGIKPLTLKSFFVVCKKLDLNIKEELKKIIGSL